MLAVAAAVGTRAVLRLAGAAPQEPSARPAKHDRSEGTSGLPRQERPLAGT